MSTAAIVVVTVGATIVGLGWAIAWAAVSVARISSKSKESA